MKLSDDGLYYWDGKQWVSTLSADGRFRWNGAAWIAVAGMAPPAYAYYQQPPPMRVPTPWTQPMQYAVAAWYVITGLYAFSLPFWMSGTMSQLINQSIQRSAAQNPEVSPPPPELISSMATMMSGFLWIAAFFGVAISVVVIIGALKRWTWMFYAVLVFLGLGTLSLPVNLFSLASGSALNVYGFPTWFYWLSLVTGLPTAALFGWMLIAVIRYGPWAMTRRVDLPAAQVAP